VLIRWLINFIMAQHTILTDTNAFIKSKQSKHQVKQPTKIKRLKDTAAACTYVHCTLVRQYCTDTFMIIHSFCYWSNRQILSTVLPNWAQAFTLNQICSISLADWFKTGVYFVYILLLNLQKAAVFLCRLRLVLVFLSIPVHFPSYLQVMVSVHLWNKCRLSWWQMKNCRKFCRSKLDNFTTTFATLD